MRSETEDRILTWLRRRSRTFGFERLGDDGAVLPAGGPWAVTQDHQIEGVHFPAGLDPSWIARRLLAVNLSDIAAMGARPRFAFLALSCPAGFQFRRFFEGLLQACRRFAVELAGGDLARNDRVTTSLTLIGDRPPHCRWLDRGSGKAGDGLWIAGTLGLSAVGRRLLELGAHIDSRHVELPATLGLPGVLGGLARRAVRCHICPRPQLEVGGWLAGRRRAAAIDISDGFAIDLGRLCRNSGVGAEVLAAALPRARGFNDLCRHIGLEPLSTQMTGGEDYSLIFTLPPGCEPPADLRCHAVGSLRAGRQMTLERAGERHELRPDGWDHFAN